MGKTTGPSSISPSRLVNPETLLDYQHSRSSSYQEFIDYLWSISDGRIEMADEIHSLIRRIWGDQQIPDSLLKLAPLLVGTDIGATAKARQKFLVAWYTEKFVPLALGRTAAVEISLDGPIDDAVQSMREQAAGTSIDAALDLRDSNLLWGLRSVLIETKAARGVPIDDLDELAYSATHLAKKEHGRLLSDEVEPLLIEMICDLARVARTGERDG